MSKGTKRKILTASVGLAAITALEGLACGNPVASRCPSYGSCGSEPAYEQPIDAAPADAMATTADAGVPDATP